jgi:hypothetical protein
MDKNVYLNEYCELKEQASLKESKLEEFINNWLNGNSKMPLKIVEDTVNKANEQIIEMKKEAKNYLKKYEIIVKEEQLQQQHLQSSKFARMLLQEKLGVDTSSYIITGGVLSTNASESHLIGREKTPEEIELDKNVALTTLREKVLSREITLAEASKLKKDIELAYETNNLGMKR